MPPAGYENLADPCILCPNRINGAVWGAPSLHLFASCTTKNNDIIFIIVTILFLGQRRRRTEDCWWSSWFGGWTTPSNIVSGHGSAGIERRGRRKLDGA